MKMLCLLAAGVLASGAALAAEEFNGSRPMDCEPLFGHDCLPTEQSCKPLKPQPGKHLNLHVDVAKMSLKTPYRNDTLPIQSFSFNTKSLVMRARPRARVERDHPSHDRPADSRDRRSRRRLHRVRPVQAERRQRTLERFAQSGRGDQLFRLHRDSEAERRAAARAVLGPKLAAVGLDDASRDAEPYPQAFGLGGEERIEDAIEPVLGDARPAIADRYLTALIFADGRCNQHAPRCIVASMMASIAFMTRLSNTWES